MCVCVCVHVHAHMPLGVSKHVRGLPTKYSPLYFLSKYLLVNSIVIAKMFGWFSLTINLATHRSVAAHHCEALLQCCYLSEIFTTLCISDWNFKSLWPQTSHPFLFLVNVWLTFWATSPPKSNPWRPRHGGGNVFRRLTGAMVHQSHATLTQMFSIGTFFRWAVSPEDASEM